MLNIAIVEDDTQQAAQLESALKTYGSEYGVLLSVTMFHSALAFLGNYSAKYDIVFMDIQMPRMNGYDATRAIRSMDRNYCRQVPIVAMTANAFAEDVQAAKTVGMNEHIAKPLDLKSLARTLDRWLN